MNITMPPYMVILISTTNLSLESDCKYTRKPHSSPLSHGQRAPFNLLILNIYDIEEMDKSPKAKYLFKETEKVILH